MKGFVQFKDGTYGNFPIHIIVGACLAGEPTAYVYRQVRSEMERVYVIPVPHNKYCFKEVELGSRLSFEIGYGEFL